MQSVLGTIKYQMRTLAVGSKLGIHKFIKVYSPDETFCALKEKEKKQYSEYRNHHLILEALENIEPMHKSGGVRWGTCGGGILPTPEMDVFHP